MVCRWREAVRCDDMHASTRHPLGQVCTHDRAGRPQSWQSAAAAMWALLRGGAAVVVRATSGTRGWQPRLRIMASTGCAPRDSGRQAGIEVARWCVRPPRRCHGPEGRAPRGRDRSRQRRDQLRAMYGRLSKVDKRGHGHEGLAEVRVCAGDGLCNGERLMLDSRVLGDQHLNERRK